MPVPSSISDLSTTAGSNSPAGTDPIGTDADNYIRAHAAFIAQLRDGSKNLEAGTATAPSLAFTGDTNTGIYSSSSDVLAFTAGGVKAAYVTNTPGFVSIGRIFANGSGGSGLGSITVSTSAASGGSDGDVWFRY